MLRKKYGLTADDPYAFTIYERDFPLSGNLAAVLSHESRQLSAFVRQSQSKSCLLNAQG
jgi:hypothetical protein